jgi:hypothetical protein
MPRADRGSVWIVDFGVATKVTGPERCRQPIPRLFCKSGHQRYF